MTGPELWRSGLSSNPVAISVTRISPSMLESCTAPKMISASSPASSWIIVEMSVTSSMARSDPPVMLISTPLAPRMDTLSRSGDVTASCAALSARFSPRPMPVPIRAAPQDDMIVRTSAKSTLTSPLTRIRSLMPWVACRSTSSAFLRASWKEVPFPTTARRRSLGTTTIVSTVRRSSARPCSAWRMRFLPSKAKGRVTTATVSAPSSLAISPITGAAPVPVPPPIPAAMNTRSAPSSVLRTSSASSATAWRPIPGRAPAPRPRVSFLPSWITCVAFDIARAWASVLAEMNSTPSSSSSIMRFTALPPAPPTPITLIRALLRGTSSNWNIIVSSPPGPCPDL